MSYYGVMTGGAAAGGGGNQYTMFREETGPSSYSTGGFVIDLSATYSVLNFVGLSVKTVGANLPVARYEYTLDSPSAGKVTVKIMRHRYDLVSAFGNVANQPSGVTVQSASGATSSSEASHTHSIDHNHGFITSGNNSNAGAGVLDQLLGSSIGTHTHTFDLANITGTSGAGGLHNHTDNTIYQHQHGANQTATNVAYVELANATNLSGTVWNLFATGTA